MTPRDTWRLRRIAPGSLASREETRKPLGAGVSVPPSAVRVGAPRRPWHRAGRFSTAVWAFERGDERGIAGACAMHSATDRVSRVRPTRRMVSGIHCATKGPLLPTAKSRPRPRARRCRHDRLLLVRSAARNAGSHRAAAIHAPSGRGTPRESRSQPLAGPGVAVTPAAFAFERGDERGISAVGSLHSASDWAPLSCPARACSGGETNAARDGRPRSTGLRAGAPRDVGESGRPVRGKANSISVSRASCCIAGRHAGGFARPDPLKLESFKQVNNADTERIGNRLQGRQGHALKTTFQAIEVGTIPRRRAY